jgi:hypothetical protein
VFGGCSISTGRQCGPVGPNSRQPTDIDGVPVPELRRPEQQFAAIVPIWTMSPVVGCACLPPGSHCFVAESAT